MSARLSDYDYVLPRELIAQRPLDRRDDSRMMVLHRARQKIEHREFREVKTFSQPGDLVVLNDTRVLTARRQYRIFVSRTSWADALEVHGYAGPQNARGRDGNDR